MANNNNTKNLNVPNLRFPEFKGEWEKYKVSDILEFFPTNSLSWDQLEYGTDNIYNLHYGLIHKGLPTQIELVNCSLPNIKKEFIPKNYTLCKDGDVAFADASEDTNDVGKVVEFLSCENKNIVCGLHTIHGRDKKNLTINGFKGYAFSSEIFRCQIRCLSQGTKIYSISPKNFKDISIGVPAKEEQSKIAALLRLLDYRIEAQNKIIEKYESLIKGLNEKLLINKKEYTTYQLSDICEIRSGYSGAQLTGTQGLMVSRIETISKHCINLDKVGYVKPFNSSADFKLHIGDILFSNINSVQYIGNTAFVDREYNLYHGMNLLRLIPHKTVEPFYIFLLLNTITYKSYFQSICNKAISQASINQTELGKTVIHIPDLSYQKQICLVYNSLYNKKSLENLYLQVLKQQKSYLLRQMFI
ncbi:Type I restriction modification DNA specificity domain protein [Bacteroides finegoldii]|uniref:Type I restriction modification DNA specificity domain-containing protein n=1 Tax=Bacteroides finegoldii CL09T03C10 TaxID=997888 RepID=K5CAT0_9BACE|nr:restriction endonuclease subunit S [Bacteroides finegoldii]EKJ90039.1 hypothetical protein HMPREF1057_03580 [Bacteroides finegoldii CL09T03C10]